MFNFRITTMGLFNIYDDVMTSKRFPHYWPVVEGPPSSDGFSLHTFVFRCYSEIWKKVDLLVIWDTLWCYSNENCILLSLWATYLTFEQQLRYCSLMYTQSCCSLQLCITNTGWSVNIFPWIYHDDVIKWKHFPRYWPFVRGIHRSPVNSLHKGQWGGCMMFSLICAWINSWVNNRREAGDLRRYRAHYDVIVMNFKQWFGILLSGCLLVNHRSWYQYWGHCGLISDLESSPQPESEVEIKLNSWTFKIINSQHQIFRWRLHSRGYIKKNNDYVQVFISYLFICLFWFSKCNQIDSNIIQLFALFRKAIFPVQTPVQQGRGHGSLTAHMNQFGRSDWLS